MRVRETITPRGETRVGGSMGAGEGLKYLKLWVTDEVTQMHLDGESAAETGIRLRLRLIAGSGRVGDVGTLPAVDEQLARLALVTLDEWHAAKATVTASWERDGDRWRLPDIVAQYEEMIEQRAKASKAARTRWGSPRKGRRPARRRRPPKSAEPCGQVPAAAASDEGTKQEETPHRELALVTPPAEEELTPAPVEDQSGPQPQAEIDLGDHARALRTQSACTATAVQAQCPPELNAYPQRPRVKSSSVDPVADKSAHNLQAEGDLKDHARALRTQSACTARAAPEARIAWLQPAEQEELSSLIAQVQQRYPRFWGQLGQMVSRAFRRRPPFEVFRHALRQLLAHEARDPVPYAEKILRVEVPNYHERAAVEKHAREQRAAVIGFEGLGRLLGRAAARAGASQPIGEGNAAR